MLDGLPPVGFAALRFALAAVVLLVLLRWREGSVRIERRDIPPLLALGVIGYATYQVLWMTALQTISAGDSALLIAATPVLTALIAVAIGSDILTPARLGGALVAFAGVAIVVGAAGGLDPDGSLVGDALTLAAACCWAVYTAWGASFLHRLTPLRMTTWTIVFGTLAMLPLGLLELTATPDAGAVVVASAGAILYSGLLSAGLPNVVVFHAVKLLGPTRITAFQFLVPAVAVVLAALFLGEPIQTYQVAGGLVIVVGVLLTRRDSLVPARLSRRVRASSRP